MRRSLLTVGLVALGWLWTAATPAEAAWNNVFQVTCWGCGHRSSTSGYYAAPVASYYAAPAVSYYAAQTPSCGTPCQQCQTNYVQRCYYQPVTTYTTQTYYEPVTTYTTRTYYEPVTTYRYSCYYDPCSCGYQQVATPCTSYVARQQCCPVQSWVQRCAQVPVTAYQKSFYWEPQTTCCTPAPTCCTPTSAVVAPAPVVVTPGTAATPPPPPAVDVRPSTPPPPTVDGKSSGPGTGGGPYNEYYGAPKDVPQAQNRQIMPSGPTQVPVRTAPAAPPSVKLDRIALAEGNVINGQIVGDNNAPKAGAQLIFVSAQRTAPEQKVTTNALGRFSVDLPQGGWLVYVRSADGQQVYHSRINIDAKQSAPILLVSR